MSHKRRKKRRRKRINKGYKKMTERITIVEKCNHPLTVKVAKHEVVCIGWRDFFYDQHQQLVEDLDVFIALTNVGFKKYQKFTQKYKNPLLQKLAEKFLANLPSLDNLIVLEVDDGDIDKDVYEIARDLLLDDKRIGFGCLAGHGRTGWLLAKLIKYFEHASADEAVRRVRRRFCKKCVESETQTDDIGCVKEKGRDEQEKLFKAQKQPSFYPYPDTHSYGNTYYEAWLAQKAKEKAEEEAMTKLALDAEAPIEVIDTADTSRRISPDLVEAWRKENRGEKLTEEEESLIMKDIRKYE